VSTATSGRKREYRVREDMRDHDWIPVMRAAASKGVADLAVVHPVHGLALVQVGTASKSIGPDARAEFVRIAHLCGALPILATATRAGIRYHIVSLGSAGTWEEFTP
jgi:hypothetical protein